MYKNSDLLHKHFVSRPPTPPNPMSKISISGQTPTPPKRAYIILERSLSWVGYRSSCGFAFFCGWWRVTDPSQVMFRY